MRVRCTLVLHLMLLEVHITAAWRHNVASQTRVWQPCAIGVRRSVPRMSRVNDPQMSGNDDEVCVLPIYDAILESKVRDTAGIEQFRLALTMFPVVLPLLAFLSYDSVVSGFHELVSFARTWYAVDGGKYELELLTPVINGVVQPGVSIVLGTLLASTLNTLRNRQVAIRTCLNKEACDIRMLEGILTWSLSGVSDAEIRASCTSSLRQYVNRIVMECRPRKWSDSLGEVSLTTESELDGIQRALIRSRRAGSARNGVTGPEGGAGKEAAETAAVVANGAFCDPYRFYLPGLIANLNAQRSTRLAELQTSYPSIHWTILSLLCSAILLDFLIESDDAAMQFLTGLRLRLLFTILVGIFSSVASLCIDLNDPFRGNFKIQPAVDQLYVIRDSLTDEACGYMDTYETRQVERREMQRDVPP